METNKLESILGAANKVLMFPSTTLQNACSEYGVKLSPAMGIAIGHVLGGSLLLLGAAWLLGKHKKNQREQQERDRIKNEIIRKQQAIINKLKHDKTLNQQEIKNLKDTVEMLENVLNQMNAA